LYRAGRLDDAARALEEDARNAGERPVPFTWAFLAMTHHRLGHPEQARSWLDKLRAFRPNSMFYWIFAAESRILLREAEALILGPTSPAMPPASRP
jgi:hypothetical protein